MTKYQEFKKSVQLVKRLSAPQRGNIGIRGKFIIMFVLTTLFPLLVMMFLHLSQADYIDKNLHGKVAAITGEMEEHLVELGEKATENVVKALDNRSQEAIERLTTDTARNLARFLYARDSDILLAAAFPQNKVNFQAFLNNRQKEIVLHPPWELDKDQSGWVPGAVREEGGRETVPVTLEENSKNFHYSTAEKQGVAKKIPLYLEMTLIDLQGREMLKVTTGDVTDPALRDISNPKNTYVKAENYFEALQSLQPGEIYVSDMIGAYVGSKIIGPYTPGAAQQRGIAFEPQAAAYAGKENPVGKRFQGLVRWATPVVTDGRVSGYLSLALDHTHIMEFTDHLVPTAERYSAISDAASGNYALMWDSKGRNISHPRDYCIVGYDPATGEPVVPWLGESLYDKWQASSLSIRKLTSAAAIPYFTGQYGDTPRGFGFVTMDANVDTFHQAAIESEARLNDMIVSQVQKSRQQKEELHNSIIKIQEMTSRNILAASLLMIVLVICVAIKMASCFTERITELVTGIKHFQDGNMGHRIQLESGDEVGQLAASFNHMAGEVEAAFQELEVSARTIGDKHSENQLLVNDMVDEIQQRVEVEKRLNQLAYYDNLTGLANRFLSLEHLSQLLKEAKSNKEQVAVLFIDLDDFKKVNDTLGHETGDKVLIEAARRLHSTVRSSDTVGRLGGDEFIVLLGGITDAANTHTMVENLIDRFREAFKVNDRGLILTASIGIAVYPEDGVNPSELLRSADTAMYHSKAEGRNTFSYFNQTMNEEVSRWLAIEEQIHGALERGEFSLCYLPKVDLNNGSIAGVEALLRWNNKILGDVSPEVFIPITEQSGHVESIGQFVLTEALGMLAEWQQKYSRSFTMAVNLSPRQLHDPGLVAFMKDTIKQSGVSGETVELEITEGVLMSGNSTIDTVLQALNNLGVSIALDDFGTGYSSLSFLHRYPFDVLKIDRSFVRDITGDTTDLELVTAAIAMAHSLGLQVVAEGVETEGQLELLVAQGCEFAQGQLFSKPLPAAKVTEMLDMENTL